MVKWKPSKEFNDRTKEIHKWFEESIKPVNRAKTDKAWKELPSKEKKVFKRRFYREHWKGGELG